MTSAAAANGWLLFACRSSYTAEVAEIIWRRGENVEALIDNIDDPEEWPCDYAPVVSARDSASRVSAMRSAVPLITPGFRFTAVEQLCALGATRIESVIDPTSVVARSASIGAGSIINALCVVGANARLGEFVHLNRNASIGHDTHLADYTTIGPAAILAAYVSVKTGAFVGAGAVCAPKVTIGANSVVGAGSVVIHDVPDFAVVAGNTARVIRTGEFGYGNASVPI